MTQDPQEIAGHAHEHLPCTDCGAAPGEACTMPGKGRSVCKPRYIAAAIALRQQAKIARRSPEQAAEIAALFARLPRLSPAEIEAGRSPAGGFTREQLAAWGVPWPPPAGWLHALLHGPDSPSPTR